MKSWLAQGSSGRRVTLPHGTTFLHINGALEPINIWGIRKKKKEGGSEKGGWKFTRFTSPGSAPGILPYKYDLKKISLRAGSFFLPASPVLGTQTSEPAHRLPKNQLSWPNQHILFNLFYHMIFFTNTLTRCILEQISNHSVVLVWQWNKPFVLIYEQMYLESRTEVEIFPRCKQKYRITVAIFAN